MCWALSVWGLCVFLPNWHCKCDTLPVFMTPFVSSRATEVSQHLKMECVCAGLPSTKALLEKCVDIIMGLGFPLSKTGDPKDKKLANEIIHGGLMAELFTGELFAP